MMANKKAEPLEWISFQGSASNAVMHNVNTERCDLSRSQQLNLPFLPNAAKPLGFANNVPLCRML